MRLGGNSRWVPLGTCTAYIRKLNQFRKLNVGE